MRKIYKHGRKVVGELEAGKFKKTVYRSKGHLFRALDAWGMDNGVLHSLPDETRIEVFDKEEGNTYSTTAGFWKKNGHYLEFKGFGLQSYLPLAKFTVEKSKIKNLVITQLV